MGNRFSPNVLRMITEKTMQGLTFRELQEACSGYSIPYAFDEFIHKDEVGAVKAAQVFSDQNATAIQIIRFEDAEKTVIRNQHSCNGSLIFQMMEAEDYLDECLREDKLGGWNQQVLLEALWNAVLHRDYEKDEPIRILYGKEDIEIVSPGGLEDSITIEDFHNGMTAVRNPQIVRVLTRFGYGNACGSGIRMIKKAYEGMAKAPEFCISPNGFRVILPRMRQQEEAAMVRVIRKEMTPQAKQVVEYLKDHEEITDEGIQNLLGVKKTRGYNIIQDMLEKQYIIQIGRGKTKRYIRNEG